MKRKLCIIFFAAAFLLLTGFCLKPAFSGTAVVEQQRAQVELVYNGHTYRYTDTFIEPTDHLVAEQIHTRRINAPLSEKLKMCETIAATGGDYKKAMLYPFPLLEKTMAEIVSSINTSPVDSEIKFHPQRKPMFTITREKTGCEVVEETLYREIYLGLKHGVKKPIQIRPKILAARVTALDNVPLTSLRARFCTDYASSSEARKNNIALSLSKINGTVLAPGAEFSFNKTVGRRTAENGFKTSKIILCGEYVDGVGGGVCQASSTVYNAALLADMSVTQARPHSLLPSYVQPSFDAMVNSGSSDLIFTNSSSSCVFIRALANGKRAEIEIYGAPMPYKISTESITLAAAEPPPDKEEIDHQYKYLSPESFPGERMRIAQGHGALKSEGYLVYRDHAGNFIKRTQIRKDTYQSLAGTVMIAP
ncbi:MAG: VanW family protein [Firmicutes bacterium]|nr:VanW family protein [Bacillota bacterium]